jgi:PAS domain S-box-containing protein
MTPMPAPLVMTDPMSPGRFALSQSLLDHASIGVIVQGGDGGVIWANAAVAGVLGVDSADLIGRPLLGFVLDDDQALLTDDAQHLLSTGDTPAVREVRWLGTGGETRWVSTRVSLAIGDAGEPLLQGTPPERCLIYNLINITERKSTEAELAVVLEQLRARNIELERSNAELTQFAYVASHDLSEPLRVIAGHVELLARRYSGQLDADADRYIAFAIDGCSRMRALIDDLLRYSRAGRELVVEPVDLAAVLAQARITLGLAMNAVDASLTIDGTLPYVNGDRSQLTQVFTNLIGNAVKYGRPDVRPEVHVRAARHDGAWQVDVADNGIGIPADQRERIFRIFQRLHGRDIPGTGIGLAICRKVIEQHEGRIDVGDSIYGGALFSITFPDRAIISE